MCLDGPATASQCHVCSQSEMSPLTGEPLVISRRMESTFEIISARYLTRTTSSLCLMKTLVVYGTSLSTSEETGARDAGFIPPTVHRLVIISTAGGSQLGVTLIGGQGEYRMKTASANMVFKIPHSVALRRRPPQVSSGSAALNPISADMFGIPGQKGSSGELFVPNRA